MAAMVSIVKKKSKKQSILEISYIALNQNNSIFHVQVNGKWGRWSDWSQCSVTCDRGEEKRSRECDSPLPMGNGSNCSGKSNETRECNRAPCTRK